MAKIGNTTYTGVILTSAVAGRHALIAAASSSGLMGLSCFSFFPTAVSKLRVYAAEAELVIDEVTTASPAVIRTTVAHGLTTGDKVDVRGTNSGTSVDGNKTATVVDATHFSVGVNNAGAAGNTGSVLTKIEDVIGTLEADDGTFRTPVVIGNGSSLIAVATTPGKNLYAAGTEATTSGGGVSVAIELPSSGGDYAGVDFA